MAALTFQLDYHTTWGQQVCLCGSIPEMGNMDESRAIVLSNEGDTWSTEVNRAASTDLRYYYFIRENNRTIRREWGEHRVMRVVGRKDYVIRDLWKDKPSHEYLYSTAFTYSIFMHHDDALPKRYPAQSVLLNVVCPYVNNKQTLVISGNCEALGEWDLKRAIPMKRVQAGEWQVIVNAKELPNRVAYKFVVVEKNTGEAIHWEDRENRILDLPHVDKSSWVYAEMALLYRWPHFTFKGVGTALPLFSLKSNDSFGIGDFADLRKMVDWATITGQQLIQLLPVNDTTATRTWRDSYPYSAISSFALHPIYLGCADFPLKKKRQLNQYRREAKKLNELSRLNYEKVLALKENYTRDLFNQEGETVLKSELFLEFYRQNRSWLFPYASYCYLRDRHGSAHFSDWGEFRVYSESKLLVMLEENPDAHQEVRFWYFVQFLLHRQFSAVKRYAHEKGVILKGDVPIGINRESVDAWTLPHLFNMDTQTGAPPDDFSLHGQNWGFPTYNWQTMKEEGYDWWVNRFRKMSDYFDAYRIDHILGFFRIWEIPLHAVQGLLGYFNPALPYSGEEISQAGIPFDEERMVQPFIREDWLPGIFGEETEEVIKNYLDNVGDHHFRLKRHCDTQRKIIELFKVRGEEASEKIRDGLLMLCTEVLFIRDPYHRNRFHPRITAQSTHEYKSLDEPVKEAFNRLYNDFFYRRHNFFWQEQALEKLPAIISATHMLACGEDLGMVPDCVPTVMDELQILSLEIERMPKSAHVAFTNLEQLPYLSVCTTSTHDMSPLRLWWREDRDLTRHYYNEVLQREGEAPVECTGDICHHIIKRHLKSSAMWVILPWQDWLSIDEELRDPDYASERINVPADPEHYWRYRMHISLEELINAGEFNARLKNMSR